MEKILVVRFGTIGDSIFASAFFREIRKNLPQAQIDVLSDKVSTGVIKHCPYIDNIIEINPDKKYQNFKKYLMIFKNYDTVYFLKNDKFFTSLAFLAGVKRRIGFDIRRNKFLTQKSPYNEDRHEVDCYLDLLSVSGLKIEDKKTEVWTDEESEEKVKQLISSPGKKVLIQAYSRFLQKNWIDTYWADVIKFLSDEMGMQVYYSGGAKDADAYNNLNSLLGEVKIPPIDLSGKLSVSESIALVKNMDLVIGIDSCSVHMAAALDIPTILIHGATSLKRWRPRSEKCIVLSKFFHCSPCCLQSGRKKYCKNKTSKCMLALKATDVINTLKTMYKTDKKTVGAPKVSIVVPVYNVERYLARCLDSILSQTLADIEIICINDGSTDESLSILKEYAKRDDRIVVVSQENKGVSAARNVGIEIAKGEYISFIDSDDWVAPNFIEKLYETAVKNNADISACGIIRCRKHYKIPLLVYDKSVVTANYNKKLELADIPTYCYVWNKLYRKEALQNSNIRFETGRIYEDVLFTPHILYYTKVFATVPDTNYYYYRHKNTIVKTRNKKSRQDYAYAMTKLKEFFKDKKVNVSAWETKVKKLKFIGLTIFKTITKRNIKKHVLFNFIKWENEEINNDN